MKSRSPCHFNSIYLIRIWYASLKTRNVLKVKGRADRETYGLVKRNPTVPIVFFFHFLLLHVFSSSFGDRESCVMDWSKKPQHVPPLPYITVISLAHHSLSLWFPWASRKWRFPVNFNPVFCLLLHYALSLILVFNLVMVNISLLLQQIALLWVLYSGNQ